MAKLKTKAFDAIYAQLQDIDGYTVLFDANGAPSVIFQITNPVIRLCTDPEPYMSFHELVENIIQTVGEGYSLQKQDIFCKQSFHRDVPESAEFLTKSYFKFFEGREYTDIKTYLILTQEAQKNNFIKYDSKKWGEFLVKVEKVADILADKHVDYRKLSKQEVNEYIHRFMAFHFRNGAFSMNNFKVSDEFMRIGQKAIKSYPLVDIDEVNLPSAVAPFTSFRVNGHDVATDVLNFLPEIPYADCVIYNQVLQVPGQRRLISKLHTKSNRHGSLHGPSNEFAKQDIDNVLEILATDSQLLVNCNFNIIVSCPVDKVVTVSSFIENKLFALGITPSKSAYNQLELFTSSFPGNSYALNPDYDLFLTLSQAAICFMYKERSKTDEDTPLKTFYTDRQGLPICIDITGKEGRKKMTDNANFFCIGPSGSGKSFHMNSVVRQLLEQGTDVVMVDTGDSYEGISSYFNGTYISYSKENPISMNPFKVSKEEYEENFGEKKNFLKSLIFLLFKGDKTPTKIEDTIINQTIVEYYDAFFHPFTSFSDEDRERLREQLLLTYRMDSDYDKYEEEMEDIEEQINAPEPKQIETRALLRPSEERKIKLIRQCRALLAVANDANASDNEKRVAISKLEEHKRELHDNQKMIRFDKQIDLMETQKRRLKVKTLCFNTYYEFALQRIPQILSLDKVSFDLADFAKVLKEFYKGGEKGDILNSDMDVNLFDERFIVFEIDKIKDDAVLFPIVVLIIMDVFLQKMRLKKGRKALIIEEAWKAISSPTMAEYIKYLYKTVRKFHGIAGVVTQELNDVIDSPIVKEAIINNSDIKILLDQTKFKDRYEDISSILGLTEIQKNQIFTINALNNKEGRNYFKEVWICRGQNSDVFGVEEPPECYWAYTTERAEKEALKIYKAYYGSIQDAIVHIEIDRKKVGLNSYLEFANLVNRNKNIMALWEKQN